MSALDSIFSATMVAQTLRAALPYACAGLGGVWSERAGVANIALEGTLLVSGLTGVAVAHATGNPIAGLFAGVLAGALVGFVHGAVAVWGRVDAIVSGIALNLLAAGGTRFLLRALYRSSSNSPAIEGFRVADGSSLLVRTLASPITWITAAMTVATVWVLARTRFGLRVRACGEDPVAASTVGIRVDRVRVVALAIGGAVCGVGGIALAFDQHQFQSGMSGGRGFIALAAVILSGWRAGRVVAACFVFAALDALQVILQDRASGAAYVFEMLPYAATLVALVVLARRRGVAGVPAGLGKHAD